MKEIKLCLDNQGFSVKPSGKEIAQISRRIADNVATISDNDSEKSFVYKVGVQGHTFCTATFKDGKRRKENFEQQQLFALDFDNKDTDNAVTFEDIKKRADEYDLPIMFAYETLSSTNHDKFRVIFKNDVSIPDIRIAGAVQQAMGVIFPEADTSCIQDVSKMYFGGNKSQLLYYDETSPKIDIDTAFRSLTYYCKDRYGAKHYKEKLARLSRKTGIALNKKGQLDVVITDEPDEPVHPTEESTGASTNDKNGGNPPFPIIYYKDLVYIKGNGENPPFYKIRFNSDGTNQSSVGSISSRNTAANHRPYRSDVLKELNKCELYREFADGTKRLEHEERFGIMTNMINIEMGANAYLSIIGKYPKFYEESESNSKRNIKYNIQQGYKPLGCEKFCPHRDKCSHGKNILTTVHPKRGRMERAANYQEKYFSLDEAQEDTYNAVYRAFQACDSQIHVIKAQCSIGKSHSYLRIMENHPDEKFLISAPTNLLKEELYHRAKKMGISVRMTPSLEPIMDELPPKVRKNILRMYTYGHQVKVHPYIEKIKKLKDQTYIKVDGFEWNYE